MLKNKLSIWRFMLVLWPLLVVFIIAQWVIRIFANSASIIIPLWLSLTDMTVFITAFVGAAIWIYKPLERGQSWLAKSEKKTQRYLEQAVLLLPKRAFKAFFFAGFCCAVYLILVLNVGAAINGTGLTLHMSIALALSLLYSVGVLAPSMALALSLAYSVRLRGELAKQGMFLHGLNDYDDHILHWNKVSRRPWVIFFITSALPASILALFVFLILDADSAVEQQFILLQAGVLFVLLMSAGAWLIFTVGKLLKQVMASFSAGLEHMRQGHYDGYVPVLSDDEFGALAKGMNTAFVGLKERKELKQGLEIAVEIHHAMLPIHVPDIEHYQLLGFEQSCEAVGGDYYDHIKLPDGRVWLVVADVAGKGYPAALTVANLRAMLHALAYLELPFEKAAAYINNTLCETLTGGRFVTLFLAKLQPESNTLLWVNAGHVPALLRRGNKPRDIEVFEASSPPMGLQSGLNFEVSECMLEKGDTLLIYSDGITEARNPDNDEMFGEKRVKEWFMKQGGSDIATLSEELQNILNKFAELAVADDVTMLWLRREE